MATFYMKLGKLHVEQSEKGDALNFGLEGRQSGGFFSLPLSARGMLHAAGAAGAALAMRGLKRKIRKITRAQKNAQSRQDRMLKGFDPGRALAGKRGRKFK